MALSRERMVPVARFFAIRKSFGSPALVSKSSVRTLEITV
jgi:hypothetical protein